MDEFNGRNVPQLYFTFVNINDDIIVDLDRFQRLVIVSECFTYDNIPFHNIQFDIKMYKY